MDEILENFGFYVRIVLLLFTWVLVAVFVSPQLASIMGLVVIALAIFVFIPLNYLREMLWQKRQKEIMAQALAYSPQHTADYAYAPGSALPPPDKRGDIILSQQTGGAVDVYRELPALPPLEARRHARSFKRTLVLPVVGLLMFLGAENDLFMHRVLEERGMAVKPLIALDQIVIPREVTAMFADKGDEIEQNARLTVKMIGACREITGGRVEALSPFGTKPQQMDAIQRGDYVYAFHCKGRSSRLAAFTVWIAPQDMNVGRIESLMNTMARPLDKTAAREKCFVAGGELVKAMGARLVANPDPESLVMYEAVGAPYAGYVYLVSNERLVLAGGERSGMVSLSCWISPEGETRARLLR